VSAVASTLGPSAYWYLARATGAVALLLLTVSVVLGILGSLRFSAGPRWPRFAIDSLHRDTSLLVIVLLVLHVITSVLDGFAPIKLTDAIIPFATPYRPLWMGLGTVSFDLLIALVVTSLMRRRLGYRSWRAIHWLAYASWPVAVLHGLGTGSDTKTWWMLLLTIACVAAVVIAVLARIARADPSRSGLRAGTAALAVATPLGMAIFTLAGPLAHGWAKRAGTPAKLLGSVSVTRPAQGVPVTSSKAAPGPLDRAFTATLSGTANQTSDGNDAIVEIAMRLGGSVQGQLRVRLGGAPLQGGGLSLTGSQVDLSANGMPSVMAGQIVSLQGARFHARVTDQSGTVVDLLANLNIDQDNGTVTGTLTGRPVKGR
jgi:methionine sulfoxide reductase heme-binding subunit